MKKSLFTDRYSYEGLFASRHGRYTKGPLRKASKTKRKAKRLARRRQR